jgi:myo-inositol-1(or 4)-monophosphatase
MMPDNDSVELDELARLAEDTARRAGAFIVQAGAKGRDRALLKKDARTKSSLTDLATEADRMSEELIVQELLGARPDDAIFGEEGGSHAGTSGLTWVIDPVDGTTNFVYDFASFAVSIAAVHEDTALVGVVHDPMKDETFVATKGGGAKLNGRDIERVGIAPPLSQSLIGTGFGYSSAQRLEQAALLPTVLPAVRDIRRAGSAALDLCYVAIGRLDAYYEAGLKAWDRAAGLLVATESGLGYADLAELIASANTLVVGPAGLLDELCALLEYAKSKALSS